MSTRLKLILIATVVLTFAVLTTSSATQPQNHQLRLLHVRPQQFSCLHQ